jgi:hypothetical protein
MSAAPTASMLPAPAAGTPLDTVSPIAIENIWAAGAR